MMEESETLTDMSSYCLIFMKLRVSMEETKIKTYFQLVSGKDRRGIKQCTVSKLN
jgi:hypothetical protein